MHRFAKLLRAEWRRLALPTANSRVIVAVSGGADSISLLAALCELRKQLDLEIFAAHFNHNLRGAESDQDAAFVEQTSKNFDFKFVSESWSQENRKSNIENRKFTDNLEQAARRARYRFLFQTAMEKNATSVLTAHTLDDQAETFLLRLIRGSGADGLGAMRAVREITKYELQITHHEENTNHCVGKSKIENRKSKILLVRPLLGWARREMTEDYCRAHGFEFRRDRMNDDTRFARVRVRKQVLPLLKTLNPKIVETLAQTADLLAQQAAEQNRQAENWLAEHDNKLLADACAPLSPAFRAQILRAWLRLELGDLRRITRKHLAALDTLICNRIGNRTIELPGKKIVVRRGNQLVLLPQVEKTPDQN